MAKKNSEPKTIEQIERMKGQTSWGRLLAEEKKQKNKPQKIDKQ